MTDSTHNNQQEDKSVPWEDFEMDDAKAEAEKQKFPLIAPGMYKAKCTGMQMVLGKKYMSDEDQKQFEWNFELVENVAAPNQPILDTEKNLLERTSFPVWSQLYQTKIRNGKPQLTRAIMTALAGVPTNAALGAVTPDSFQGKLCQVYVGVGFKQDNITEKNTYEFSALPLTAVAQPPTPEATTQPATPEGVEVANPAEQSVEQPPQA